MTGRVLIVEDDHLTALSLRALLDLVGFEIVGTASRVKDALAQAEQTSPEMAIFDVRLAGKRDGIEGATLLRQLLDIPVVLLTARTDPETEARASIARPAAILQKPVPSKVFISAVRKAMQETRATRRAEPKAIAAILSSLLHCRAAWSGNAGLSNSSLAHGACRLQVSA